MIMKSLLVIFTGIAIAWGGWALPAYAQGTAAGQAYAVDPETSALMLRKGKEAFSRARYGEAREYFRKAVQADPNSQKAWSFYDLAQLYTVAEQFKNHGRVVTSTAPAPEQTADLTTALPAAPMPPTAPVTTPTKEKTTPAKEKAAPAKKEKPVPAVKEKPTPSTEVKKPTEPAKPAVSAPAPPAPPTAPAPKPTPAPGGMKILKDEGC